MTMEPMPVWIEVWPLAADQTGIWLLSGNDAWRPTLAVPSDGDVHDEVEALLWEHKGERTDHLDTIMIHSTSWRQDRCGLVVTYVVVVDTESNVLDEWRHAQPIHPDLWDMVGKPTPHRPTDPPLPSYIHVLQHAIRHLAFLLDTDEINGGALSLPWRRHLAKIKPAIAGMYRASA
jgi:hypothetical protein